MKNLPGNIAHGVAEKGAQVAGNVIHLTIQGGEKAYKALKSMFKGMKEFAESDAPGQINNMIDALAGADTNPITLFLNANSAWLQVGAADGMQRISDAIFNPANITIAQGLTTEFGRLASEGLRGLITEIDKTLPGAIGFALAIKGVYDNLGPLGTAVALVSAGLQWVSENWEDIKIAWEGFLDGLRSWWEDYSWLFPFGSGGWVS